MGEIQLPDTPVGHQLAWVFDQLVPGLADEAEITARFEPGFLEQIPAISIKSMIGGGAGLLGALTITNVATMGEHSALVAVTGETGLQVLVMGSVAADEPHRFSSLIIRPAQEEPEAPTTNCNVIVLNGTSSSGKSSLAKALQLRLDGVWLHVEIDAFLRMIPPKALGDIDHVVRTAHAAMGAMARAGSNLIVDHVLERGPWLDDLKEELGAATVWWVGVRCDPGVVDQRERDRGDRMIGQARLQLQRVHADRTYDIEIDTSATPIEDCAEAVAGSLPVADRMPT